MLRGRTEPRYVQTTSSGAFPPHVPLDLPQLPTSNFQLSTFNFNWRISVRTSPTPIPSHCICTSMHVLDADNDQQPLILQPSFSNQKISGISRAVCEYESYLMYQGREQAQLTSPPGREREKMPD